MSAFADIAEVAPQAIWEGITGRALHGERLTLALIELDSGAHVPEHAHDNEQVGILLQGSFELRVGSEDRSLSRGDTWCIPPDVPHEARVGPEGAVVVEVWVPGREDWTGIEPQQPRAPRGF